MEIGQSSSPAPWKKYSWDPKIQTSGVTPPAPPPHVSKAHPLSWRPPPFLDPPSSIFISKPPVSFLLAETTPFSRLQAGTPLPVPGTDSTPNPLRSQAQQVPRRARPPTPSPWRTHVAHSRTPLRAHTHTSSLAALEMRGAKSPHPLSSVGHEKSGWEEVATREKEQIGAKAKSEGRTNSNWVVLRLLRLSSPPSQRVRFQHKSARGIAAPCNQ